MVWFQSKGREKLCQSPKAVNQEKFILTHRRISCFSTMGIFHPRCHWYSSDMFRMMMRRRVVFAWKVCQQDCQVSMSKRNREASIEIDLSKKTGSGHMWVILSSLLVIQIDLSC